MPRSARPKLKVGQFSKPVPVPYNCIDYPELSGVFEVSLGAEYRQALEVTVRRHAKVNQDFLSIYAMVRDPILHTDRVILRDEAQLRIRAIETHITHTLIPRLEREKDQRNAVFYEASLLSADNWYVDIREQQGTISIQPIHLDLHFDPTSSCGRDKGRKVILLNRIVQLVKRHGLDEP